jgi:hypothetical protein
LTIGVHGAINLHLPSYRSLELVQIKTWFPREIEPQP